MLGKHTLDPDEKAELKVVYTTEGTPGPFRKKVIISTNIPGKQNLDIFTIHGEVLEAPGAKISVHPRRVVLDNAERGTGKRQIFTVTNEGSLPLVITRIQSKDGKTVHFDGKTGGAVTIEPGREKEFELQLEANKGDKTEREYIIVDSNARNTGESGLVILIQYGK
jgi:hypothetical protein